MRTATDRATLSAAILILFACCSISPAVGQEAELLAVLQSNASPAEKAITCKKLAIQGTSAAVPELAKLLPDPQLSSWARIALEAIPGQEANEALREAAETLSGRLQIGMINSLGVRRDSDAVDLLAKGLRDSAPEIASAAAVALGNIGTAAAAESLTQALAASEDSRRSAIAEGLVLCAERFHAEGDSSKAIEIYDLVRDAEVPKQRVIEATRGAILARGQEGIPLLLELLESSDRHLFRLGLGTVREFPGNQIDRALADQLAEIEPSKAALLIQAMSDRSDTVIVPVVLTAAKSGPKPVRLSAIEALKRVGDDSCLESLMAIASEADAELSDAAKETLAEYPGQQIDQRILATLQEAQGQQQQLMLELIGRRRIDAVPHVTKALRSSDPKIRHAALVALGETVSLDQLSVLIEEVTESRNAVDREIAEAALRTASVRMPDREACAALLTAALDRASLPTKTKLLEIISQVGGDRALDTLASATKSGEERLLDTSSRLLGKWNELKAAPVLLELASSAENNRYKVRALRGYLGLARKFADGKQRAEMCQQAIDLAIRPNEQKLALDVLTLRPSAAGLSVAIGAQKLPGIEQEARAAALAIAAKLGEQGIDIRESISSAGLAPVDLEVISAKYGAGAKQKDVTKDLRRLARDLPLITLPSRSYNASFGGDPAPGVAKQLTIEYRLNGKSGQATLDENALILLPLPK